MGVVATITYNQVVDRARVPLNDAAKGRYTDDELASYLNDALMAMVGLRSDLFNFDGLIPCTAGTVDQQLPLGGVSVLDIYQASAGGVTRGVSRTTFNALRSYRPTWRVDVAAVAQSWLYAPEDLTKQGGPNFFIYPQAPSGQVLNGLYIKLPAQIPTYAAGNVVLPVPDYYSVPLQFYVVGRAEMKDDEHVNSNRAAQMTAQFEAMVKEANIAEDASP